MRFHGETSLSDKDASRAITEFLDFVEHLLRDDAFEMFVTLMRFPICTVTLSERIYKALEKIFDGRNPVFSYEFRSDDHAVDWDEYRMNKLGGISYWKDEGFEAMKTDINSFVVVDLPADQGAAERPEPYSYFLNLDRVIDFESVDGKGTEWIIFNESGNKIAVFDDTSYRIYETENGDRTSIKGDPVVENVHGLGYCPVRFFWTTPVSKSKPFIKKSPLSNQLGRLDMLLFFDTGGEHLNVVGRWPIFSGFRADCDYTDEESGVYCYRGFLRNQDSGYYILKSGKPKSCPVCDKKKLNGPGSYVEVDPPSKRNGNADLRNPVSITSIDRESLDYNNADLDRREMKIYSAVTGYQGMPINDQAVNEKQVVAIFESMEAALEMPQMNFEEIIQWRDSTICRLRYGKESFIGATISLGTEHYIFGASEILNLYELAKKAAFNVSILNMLEKRYYETEYKNNQEELKRQKVITHLDPFRHRSVSEVATMYKNNEVRYEDYMIKANFSSFIMRFERENISIVNFAEGLEFDQKIKRIQDVLIGYAKEMKPEIVAPEVPLGAPAMV